MRGRKAKSTVAVAAFVAALIPAALFVNAALAGPTTSAPTIVAKPADPSPLTSATFTYKGATGSAAVSFKCSLDGGSYSACGSGTATTSPPPSTSYTGLVPGSHTFRVTAQAKGSAVSDPATYTWRIDTSAPTITPSFPAASGAYNGAGWGAGCTAAGLCGTAADPSGVASVRVAILQQSTGRYWNGPSFSATAITYLAASGTTAWSYPLAFSNLGDGQYTLSVTATDAIGNATPLASPKVVTFRIDTTAPLAPTITGKPLDPTPNRGAQFSFSAAEVPVAFRCQIDGGPFSSCLSGLEYNDLPLGAHCFAVVAVDLASNVSSPTSYCWTIILQGSFPIKGDLLQPMAPGVTRALDLVISNPESFDLLVTGVSVAVNDATTKAGAQNSPCVGSVNLRVDRPFSGTVVVPAKSTRSLSQLTTPAEQWPLIIMPDLATNQDACKATNFTFTYSGTATKA